MRQKTVVVVGLGYVGLPLVLLSDTKGYSAVGIDHDKKKIDLINQKRSPFADKKIEEEIKKSTLLVTTDFSAVEEADIIIICVPTPVYKNRQPNYEPVEGACRNIAPFLKKGQLIVLESTVNPGVCEEIVLPIVEKISGLKVGKDIYLAHCPERINPGDRKWDVSNIPRVVGGFDKESLSKALSFYRSIISAEIKPMGSLKEAEAVKVVENSFRNVNIAFVNELARSFSKLGIDIINVIKGAATKPYAFMAHFPGCGVGGHCIPVDPYYLINYARKFGFEHKLLKLSCKINEQMPHYTVRLVEKGLKEKGKQLEGARVSVLGLAYKAEIDDCRESPAFEIIKILKEKGAKVVVFDPHTPDKSDVGKIEEALSGSEAVVIATDHALFRGLKGSELAGFGIKVVVDGRNCLNKSEIQSAGLIYFGIGR
jgi:nucleotide sugar dehydrogenase